MDVFLCHNSQDKPIVRRLSELLESSGFKVWVDEAQLDGGVLWQEMIGQAMVEAAAVIVCLGPHGLGPTQNEEIQIVVRKRQEGKKVVIPLILPSCGDVNPDIPLWLTIANVIDLRRDETDSDPFGRLLKSIDSREPTGHYRPSVLVLRNKEEPTSEDACRRIVSECQNVLHRVRVMDYSDTLLEACIPKSLQLTDVLVSLLAPNSFERQPGKLFADGIAPGAKSLARKCNTEVIQWRSDKMALPKEPDAANRFRSTEIEICLSTPLVRSICSTAEGRFARRRLQADATAAGTGKCKAVFGYPFQDREFIRQVVDELDRLQIECDSPPKWELVLSQLQLASRSYEAIIVVLTGDLDWLCNCTVALQELQNEDKYQLPRIRAFLHKADSRINADLIPIRLKDFEEYYGLAALPSLAKKIASKRGQA